MSAIHAIRTWDAASGEDTLCGVLRAHPQHVERSQLHEYVTCADCRSHPDFDADRGEAPWPIPATVAESTAQLQERQRRRAAAS